MSITLNTAAIDALLAQPVAYIVWRKVPGRGQRWKRLGEATTHSEAVKLVTSSTLAGDFWIAEVRDQELAGTLPQPPADAEPVPVAPTPQARS